MVEIVKRNVPASPGDSVVKSGGAQCRVSEQSLGEDRYHLVCCIEAGQRLGKPTQLAEGSSEQHRALKVAWCIRQISLLLKKINK